MTPHGTPPGPTALTLGHYTLGHYTLGHYTLGHYTLGHYLPPLLSAGSGQLEARVLQLRIVWWNILFPSPGRHSRPRTALDPPGGASALVPRRITVRYRLYVAGHVGAQRRDASQ